MDIDPEVFEVLARIGGMILGGAIKRVGQGLRHLGQTNNARSNNRGRLDTVGTAIEGWGRALGDGSKK